MIDMHRTLRAYGSPDFETTLRRDLLQAGPEALGLQQALRAGSIALEDDLGVMLLSARESPTRLDLHLGLFYTSMVAGCSCADDPTPVGRNTEYCEVDLQIERATAQGWIVPQAA